MRTVDFIKIIDGQRGSRNRCFSFVGKYLCYFIDELGWNEALQRELDALHPGSAPGRVSRLDRGWSSLLPGGADGQPRRTRNIGADVAVGDWVVPSADGERVEHILTRSSALVRRASFAGARAESHTLAANVDVVGLLHALTSPPNPRSSQAVDMAETRGARSWVGIVSGAGSSPRRRKRSA